LVIEKDSDNETARRLLGYTKDKNGIWTTQEQRLLDIGLVQTGKGCRTQQQIEVDKILESRRSTNINWQKEIKSIIRGLPNNEQSRKAIMAIDAPNAAAAIASALAVEPNPDTRILLIRALSNIGTSATIQEIARWSINQTETISSVKRTCFDELRKHEEAKPILVGLYTSQLNPRNGNFAINAAALALAELGGETAVPQLIDVLITTQVETYLIKPNGMIADTGTTGLEWGSPRAVRKTIEVQNVGVLQALCVLTGMNFQFDKIAWKRWLVQSRRSQYFDARRND
jgi:hypothetical protein